MKARIKVINNNGASPIEEYENFTELRKFLNEMLYYSHELILNIESNYTENYKYSEITDLRALFTDANFYNSVVCINVIYEEDEQ